MRVFGFAGLSGSGKTTLIEKLLPLLRNQGLTVSVIKHAHHPFDLDRPGKDSYRHRAAGAQEVLISSGTRWALLHELRGAPEPSLAEHLRRLSPCDLVLVEGYKAAGIPTLEVYRVEAQRPPLSRAADHFVGVASDRPFSTALPWFHRDDVAAIAQFVMAKASQ